jgi:hypothetical protein
VKRVALILVAIVAIGACARVLGLSKSGPQPFPHRKHVIAGVTCVKCHPGIDKDDGVALHVPDEASCTECHAKPHDSRPCFGCHVDANALPELVEARQHLVFDHGKHMPQTRGNCMRCHVGIAEGDTNLRPAMATCFACHDNDAASNASKCSACHKNLEATDTLPQSHLAHDGDWVHDHGVRAASSGDMCQTCHRETFCASCHGQTVAALPSKMQFDNPFAPSVHRAGFTSRHSLEARSEPGACTTCHQPDRCASCHVAKGVAGTNRSPHPPGWVGPTAGENQHGREARRDPSACASCHDGAGQKLCVSCHQVGGVGGSPHPAGWTSRLPLSSMPCRMCHPIGSQL